MMFFTTGTGNIGVSVDEGETIINHQGRRLPLSPAMSRVWFETDEAEVEDLTPDCRAAAEALGAKLDEVADADLRREEERREAVRREREEREERSRAHSEWLNSPEGRAVTARRDAAFARDVRALLRTVQKIRESL